MKTRKKSGFHICFSIENKKAKNIYYVQKEKGLKLIDNFKIIKILEDI